MIGKRQRRKIAILNTLRRHAEPLSSSRLAEVLANDGMDISERTVRLDLIELDKSGLTHNLGRRGRQISDKGLAELNDSQTLERVGLLSAKIDRMSYRMTFDLERRTGTVVINLSLVRIDDLFVHLNNFQKVFEKGYAMGRLVTVLGPGERLDEITVPEGMIGLGTVCSITLNGVLLKHGIPTTSRFGGLLELKNGEATRFVEIINYDGTSIDPLEAFIRSAMTDYLGAIATGNGRIGASFREVPDDSRDQVIELAEKLNIVGLGGFMQIGHPSSSLLGIPVSEGRAGVILIGGLNPIAVYEEAGVRIFSRALSGLYDFGRLFPYTKLKTRLKEIL